MVKDRKVARRKVRYRVRKKVSGSHDRPRVAVYRSLNNIYVQAVDDVKGVTLTAASSLDKALRRKLKSGGNVKAAEAVGALMADRLKERGLTAVVFDRGGFIYHGRVKAVAEAMRKGGISF